MHLHGRNILGIASILGSALALPLPQAQELTFTSLGGWIQFSGFLLTLSATTVNQNPRPTRVALRPPSEIFALLGRAPHVNSFTTTRLNTSPTVSLSLPLLVMTSAPTPTPTPEVPLVTSAEAMAIITSIPSLALGQITMAPTTTVQTSPHTSSDPGSEATSPDSPTTETVLQTPSEDISPFPTQAPTRTLGDQSQDKPRQSLGTLAIVGIVFVALLALTLLAFCALNPRVKRFYPGKKKNGRFGKRPNPPFWSPFTTSPNPPKKARKPVNYGREVETEKIGTLSSPRSKFSVTSSDYSHGSRQSTSTTDTVVIENTRANAAPQTPVRPPRPLSLDSPNMVLVDDAYFIPVTLVGGGHDDPFWRRSSRADTSGSTTAATESPLLPPSLFFTMEPSQANSTSAQSLQLPQIRVSNPDLDLQLLTSGDDGRHRRNTSAPMFVGNPIDEKDSRMPPLDLVARKVLQHRRSRSTSGWAYPRRNNASTEAIHVESDQGGEMDTAM